MKERVGRGTRGTREIDVPACCLMLRDEELNLEIVRRDYPASLQHGPPTSNSAPEEIS